MSQVPQDLGAVTFRTEEVEVSFAVFLSFSISMRAILVLLEVEMGGFSLFWFPSRSKKCLILFLNLTRERF